MQALATTQWGLDKGRKNINVADVRLSPVSLDILSLSMALTLVVNIIGLTDLSFKSSTPNAIFFLTALPVFRTFAIRGQWCLETMAPGCA